MAARKSWSRLAVVESKYGELAAGPGDAAGRASSLSARAIESNSSGRRRASRRSPWPRPRPPPTTGRPPGSRPPTPPTRSSLGEYRMWRILIASAGESASGSADVDLADLALRSRLGGVGDDLVLELLVDARRRPRPSRYLARSMSRSASLAWYSGVDGLGARSRVTRPMRIDAVLALEDRGRRRRRRRANTAVDEGLVDCASSFWIQPRSPACGAVARRSRRSWRPRPRPCRPAGPRGPRRPWPWRRPSGRRSARSAPASTDRLDLDDPGVARARGSWPR